MEVDEHGNCIAVGGGESGGARHPVGVQLMVGIVGMVAIANLQYGWTLFVTASLLVPLGNVLQVATGSWMPIFIVAIAFDWIGALLAFFVLKPLRIRWVAGQARAPGPSAAGPARAPR